jgi:pimeloyl-ACP methyl ester carboxylesterase
MRAALAGALLAGCTSEAGTSSVVPLAHTVMGRGPAVVLLHGHPQTADSWRAVAPVLAERYRVVVVDQRGQGASPAPDTGYDMATRAADVAALLRRLDIASAVVVGTDLGGHTAFALARDEPDLVRRLAVLEAVVPGTRAATGPLDAPHIRRHADVEEMVERTRGREAEHVRDFVCADRAPCPHPPELLAAYADALRRPGHLRGAFAPYRELVDPPAAPGRIDVPVLAVGGSRGIGGLPGSSLREVADDVTSVVLPGATHWLAEEHPQQLLAALEPFLAEVTTGAPS